MKLSDLSALILKQLSQNILVYPFFLIFFIVQVVRFSFSSHQAIVPILVLGLLLATFYFGLVAILKQFQLEKSPTNIILLLAIIPTFLLALWNLDPSHENISYQFSQVSLFVSFFLILYLSLRKNILTLIHKNLNRFDWNQFSRYQQANTSQDIAHCELTSGTIFKPLKNQIITKNCLVDSGSAVFALLKQPFRWSKNYVSTGDVVPAGSYLVAGKIELVVDNLNDEDYLFFLRDYFHSEKFGLSTKLSVLLILVFCLVIYLALSFSDFSILNFVFVCTVVFSLLYFLDLFYLYKKVKSALKERLASRAIFCNDFSALVKYPISLENIPSDFQVKNVSKLKVLSDLILEDRVALLIFYLTSYSDQADFLAIHESMQTNYFQQYLNNPIENIKVYPNGFLATLEGIALCFGSEQFLLENGIILNTNEVMGRAKNNHAYYLSLNREVYAGLEVQDRLFHEFLKESEDLDFLKNLTVQQDPSLPTVDFKQLGKNLHVVEERSDYQTKTPNKTPNLINIFFERTFSQMIEEQQKFLLVFNLVSPALIKLPFVKVQEYLILKKYLIITFLICCLIVVLGLKFQFIAIQLIALVTFIFVILFRKKLVTLLSV